MNKSANEFEFGILGFYFIYLCFTYVLDFMVLFRRLIMARVVFASSLYSENCFDKMSCFLIPGFVLVFVFILSHGLPLRGEK